MSVFFFFSTISMVTELAKKMPETQRKFCALSIQYEKKKENKRNRGEILRQRGSRPFSHCRNSETLGGKPWNRTSFSSPTNNAALINFRLISDAEIFVTKHRLSMQNCRQTCKDVYAMLTRSNRASIFAYHRWWLGPLLALIFNVEEEGRKRGGGGNWIVRAWRERENGDDIGLKKNTMNGNGNGITFFSLILPRWDTRKRNQNNGEKGGGEKVQN